MSLVENYIYKKTINVNSITNLRSFIGYYYHQEDNPHELSLLNTPQQKNYFPDKDKHTFGVCFDELLTAKTT